jgi:hypothetical protein
MKASVVFADNRLDFQRTDGQSVSTDFELALSVMGTRGDLIEDNYRKGLSVRREGAIANSPDAAQGTFRGSRGIVHLEAFSKPVEVPIRF